MTALTSIWAVARQTFLQCLRSRIGGVFFVLLALVLIIAPTLNSDASVPLADRIRTFLSYSIGGTTLLLCIVTVFLTTSIVPADVEKKQIFILIVKPLARWQYVLGRWMGVVLLDAVLVALTGAAIYGIATYMRAQPPISPTDRRMVETEVFAARGHVGPDFTKDRGNIEQRLAQKVEEAKKQGIYADAIDRFAPMFNGNRQQAEMALVAEYRKQLMEGHQSVPPGRALKWVFSGVKAQGSSLVGEGTVELINPRAGVMEIAASHELMAPMMAELPVRVDGVDGRVVQEGHDRFLVQFPPQQLTVLPLSKLAVGARVQLRVDPVVQISYKPNSQDDTKGTSLRCRWIISPPSQPSGDRLEITHSDPPGQPATITVPARLVDENGRLQAIYLNETATNVPATVSIREEDIVLLYRVGSFEVNFIKSLGLMLLQLMFVAALGVAAASFLGFAVGAMLAMVLVGVGLSLGFTDSAIGGMDVGVMQTISSLVAWLAKCFLGNMGALSPSSSLVGGLTIAWAEWSAPVLWTLGRVSLLLGLACLIFHKRELARVQV